jgi:hypothetical protein
MLTIDSIKTLVTIRKTLILRLFQIEKTNSSFVYRKWFFVDNWNKGGTEWGRFPCNCFFPHWLDPREEREQTGFTTLLAKRNEFLLSSVDHFFGVQLLPMPSLMVATVDPSTAEMAKKHQGKWHWFLNYLFFIWMTSSLRILYCADSTQDTHGWWLQNITRHS